MDADTVRKTRRRWREASKRKTWTPELSITSRDETLPPVEDVLAGIQRSTGLVLAVGDIRRATLSPNEMLKRRSAEMMSTPPRSIKVGVRGVDALMEMEKERVMALLVLDDFGLPTGIVHIHDILRFGLGLERPPSKALKASKTKDTPTT